MERKIGASKQQAKRAEATGQPFGAHMSVAGGLENAFHAGVAAGCDCVQIFVKNQRQWSAPPLTEGAIEAYRKAAAETGLAPVIAHASYLINLASPEPVTRRRSIDALADELHRCVALPVPYLVLHPGAHLDQGLDAGIDLIVAGLDEVHRRVENPSSQILLEATAGQGSAIGHEVEHLGRILSGVADRSRLGVCVDTCHVFAAGYDIRTAEGYERLIGELRQHVGLDRIKCIHVNDSVRDCGSRVDRHEHIGKGKIGDAGFIRLLNDPRLADVPKILETPKGVDGRGTDLDRVNLKRLRGFIGREV